MASVCTVKRAARAAWGDERCLLSDLSEVHRPFARRANPVNGQVLILPQPRFLFYNNSAKIIPVRVIFKDESPFTWSPARGVPSQFSLHIRFIYFSQCIQVSQTSRCHDTSSQQNYVNSPQNRVHAGPNDRRLTR